MKLTNFLNKCKFSFKEPTKLSLAFFIGMWGPLKSSPLFSKFWVCLSSYKSVTQLICLGVPIERI